jgi:hypothetical protein
VLDQDRKQLITRTIKMLTDLLSEHDQVMQALADQRAGYPSGGDGGEPSGEPIRDPARETKNRLNRRVLEVLAKADDLDGIRQNVLKSTVKPGEADPGCEIIAKYAKESHEYVYRTSDVGGRLPRKYALGQWAYDQVLANGTDAAGKALPASFEHLPTQEETLRHSRGYRVRRPKKRAS